MLIQQQCYLCQTPSKEVVCEFCEQKLPTQNHRCKTCALPLVDNQSQFCGQCLVHTPIINQVFALYDYQDALPYLIKQFKYQHQLFIGNFLAKKVLTAYQAISHHQGQYDQVIPMPLHQNRIKERGFNQSLELVRLLQKQHPNLINYQSVSRIKHNPAFSGLGKKQRQILIKNTFMVNNGHLSQANKILLIDDIMTTGSSLNELAKVLKQQYPTTQVDALCLARAKLKK